MITYRKLEVNEAQSFWNLMNQLDYETKYMLYEPGERAEKASNVSKLEYVIRYGGWNIFGRVLYGKDNRIIIGWTERKTTGGLA